MLRACPSSQFPSGCEIGDIVQEAFIRVLRARTENEVRSPEQSRGRQWDWIAHGFGGA